MIGGWVLANSSFIFEYFPGLDVSIKINEPPNSCDSEPTWANILPSDVILNADLILKSSYALFGYNEKCSFGLLSFDILYISLPFVVFNK